MEKFLSLEEVKFYLKDWQGAPDEFPRELVGDLYSSAHIAEHMNDYQINNNNSPSECPQIASHVIISENLDDYYNFLINEIAYDDWKDDEKKEFAKSTIENAEIHTEIVGDWRKLTIIRADDGIGDIVYYQKNSKFNLPDLSDEVPLNEQG